MSADGMLAQIGGIVRTTVTHDVTLSREGRVYTIISTTIRPRGLAYGNSDATQTARRLQVAAATLLLHDQQLRVVYDNEGQVSEVISELAVVRERDHERALYWCSTTGLFYRPLSLKYEQQASGSLRWAWAFCPFCDVARHTRQDPAYDALHPQPHLFTIAGGAQ